ncbi:hypothetical protein JZ751_005738 [Albula glossodonta]|uniref:Uncharacterized protein n=1 Tax=Albula glossodonta TaxID=121402 RepID=A0A8T2N4B7_9TELE|nr:hypothetical protein JZ751_005738 [Albula glossodonta]
MLEHGVNLEGLSWEKGSEDSSQISRGHSRSHDRASVWQNVKGRGVWTDKRTDRRQEQLVLSPCAQSVSRVCCTAEGRKIKIYFH